MALDSIFYLLSALCLISGSQIHELKCWTQRNRTHYAGPGLQNTAIDDTVECINKCRETSFCRAVDIDTNTKGHCWYQQNRNFVASETDLRPMSTVTNYLYNPTCGEITRGVDLNCWTVSAAHQILGLTQTDRKTLADCLSECKRRQDCWAVDWDVKTSPSCWVQTKPMEVSLSRLIERFSVTNFILNRDCINLIGGADLRFWRVSDFTGYASPGLVEVDKWDLQSCIDYCLSNENCNMFDYDPSTKPPCWAQTNPFPILRGKLIQSRTCYNFLLMRKEYQESHATVTVEEQSSCWFYKDDYTYSGAGLKSVPSVKTLNQCLNLCFETSSCGAATFQPSSNEPCSYVEGNLDMNKFSKKAGVTSYVPNRDCSNMDKDKKK